VTASTDGCSDLRTILTSEEVTKLAILDWFHIAMRLQHTKLAATNLSTHALERVTAKATIVGEVESLHWRIWKGKARNAPRSITRIRKVMHVFKRRWEGVHCLRLSDWPLGLILSFSDQYSHAAEVTCTTHSTVIELQPPSLRFLFSNKTAGWRIRRG
jgi:hypothetical protein